MGVPRSNIRCNECGRLLTQKEASVYDLQWKHSGDMHCMKHRNCVDDCRRTPCRLVSLIETVIHERKGIEDGGVRYIPVYGRTIQAAKDLGREGKWSGGTWRLLYVAQAWRLQVKRGE